MGPILLTSLLPSTERVREFRPNWTGWGSGTGRVGTLAWQDRDAQFRAAVNKKHAKTTDLNEKSRGRDLGFLR